MLGMILIIDFLEILNYIILLKILYFLKSLLLIPNKLVFFKSLNIIHLLLNYYSV